MGLLGVSPFNCLKVHGIRHPKPYRFKGSKDAWLAKTTQENNLRILSLTCPVFLRELKDNLWEYTCIPKPYIHVSPNPTKLVGYYRVYPLKQNFSETPKPLN